MPYLFEYDKKMTIWFLISELRVVSVYLGEKIQELTLLVVAASQ